MTARGDPPLVVDLDDTLIQTDSFLEQALVLVKQRPRTIPRLVRGLAAGRARLKAIVMDESTVDAANMPYHIELVDFLRAENARGRRIILASAADKRVADAVADHLGIFETVLASTENNNLKGQAKADAIAHHLEGAEFDYVGDSLADRAIWAAAGRAHVVAADMQAAQKRAGSVPVARVFTRPGLTPKVMLRAMRIHQWAKNALIFVPLILSHTYDDPGRIFAACLAFLCLGLCASGTYLWNDLLDLPDDRAHPTKRNRPLASGRMTIRDGVVASFLLVGSSLILAGLFNGVALVGGLLVYILLTLAYSMIVKRKMVADVLLLAMLFLYRIMLGAIAIGVVVSDWLLAFSIFFFLSLGFAKRVADLPPEVRQSDTQIAGRAYRGTDAPILAVLGAGAGLSSIIIMALYITDAAVVQRYQTPQLLWVICLVLLYWLNRIWIMVYRGDLPHDPVVFALKDRNSRILGVLIIIMIVLARF